VSGRAQGSTTPCLWCTPGLGERFRTGREQRPRCRGCSPQARSSITSRNTGPFENTSRACISLDLADQNMNGAGFCTYTCRGARHLILITAMQAERLWLFSVTTQLCFESKTWQTSRSTLDGDAVVSARERANPPWLRRRVPCRRPVMTG
jgi:hypothetical protein